MDAKSMKWKVKYNVHCVRIVAYISCIMHRNKLWLEARIVYVLLTCSQCIKIICAKTDSCNGGRRGAIEHWIITRMAGSDETSVLNLNIQVSCAKMEFKHYIRQVRHLFCILDEIWDRATLQLCGEIRIVMLLTLPIYEECKLQT